MVETMCTAGLRQGEQLESASPLDVIFWMIHPVLDRMTTAKRLSASADIEFGSFGTLKPFQDDSWLEYSYYTTNDYTCTGTTWFLF